MPSNDELDLIRRIEEIRADRQEAKQRGAWNAASALHRSENQVLKELRLLRAAERDDADEEEEEPDEVLIARMVQAVPELPEVAIRALVERLIALGVAGPVRRV